MSDSSDTAAEYDAMAEEYTAENDDGVFNALYERPAMLSFLGEVAGRRVLDIGCGAGQLSLALSQRNAAVIGIDVSSRMVELAKKRLGNQIDVRVHDLSQPLPFEDSSFDIVVASLVMHYLETGGQSRPSSPRGFGPGERLSQLRHSPATRLVCAHTVRGTQPDRCRVSRAIERFGWPKGSTASKRHTDCPGPIVGAEVFGAL